jgi:hypothetical protein
MASKADDAPIDDGQRRMTQWVLLLLRCRSGPVPMDVYTLRRFCGSLRPRTRLVVSAKHAEMLNALAYLKR